MVRPGIDRSPRPRVASALNRGLHAADVLLLRCRECPDFIDLNAPGRDVAHRRIVVGRASLTSVHQHFETVLMDTSATRKAGRFSPRGPRGISGCFRLWWFSVICTRRADARNIRGSLVLVTVLLGHPRCQRGNQPDQPASHIARSYKAYRFTSLAIRPIICATGQFA